MSHLPTLIVAGAAKSGSTSLHEYLDAHSNVYMSKQKEPHFLSAYDSSDRILSAYEELFAGSGEVAVRGESSVGYMVIPKALEQMSKLIPKVRIIFVLRNPVERAWSHYRWLVESGAERRSLRTAFPSDMFDTPTRETDVGMRFHYYFQNGLYGAHIERYLDHFERSQIHVLTTRELSSDPEGSLGVCWWHAGVEPIRFTPQSRGNVTTSLRFPRTVHLLRGEEVVHRDRTDFKGRALKRAHTTIASTRGIRGVARRGSELLARIPRTRPELSDQDRKWIASYYVEDVARLRSLLGRDFREWDSDFPVSAAN